MTMTHLFWLNSNAPLNNKYICRDVFNERDAPRLDKELMTWDSRADKRAGKVCSLEQWLQRS